MQRNGPSQPAMVALGGEGRLGHSGNAAKNPLAHANQDFRGARSPGWDRKGWNAGVAGGNSRAESFALPLRCRRKSLGFRFFD